MVKGHGVKQWFILLTGLLVWGIGGEVVGEARPQGEGPTPPFTIESILIFYSATDSSLAYTFRGREQGNPANWQWWSIGPTGQPDLTDPVKPLPGNPVVQQGDVAYTRGGNGVVAWESNTTGSPACGGNAPRGRVQFTYLDARLWPESPPAWSAPTNLALGPDFTYYDNSQVALDVTGKGLAIWRERVYGHDISGCLTGDDVLQMRYRLWDGEQWVGDPEGILIPASASAPPSGDVDLAFTSVRLDPIGSNVPETRQQAIAVWTGFVGIGSELCPGPVTAEMPEYWPQYAVWDGETFSAAAVVPNNPNTDPDPPFYSQWAIDSINLGSDTTGSADLIFNTIKYDHLCVVTQHLEAWTARWEPGIQAWADAEYLDDGQGPGIGQRRDDVAVAGYRGQAGGIWSQQETVPGGWGNLTPIAAAPGFSDPVAVAGMRDNRTTLVYRNGTDLYWTEDTGSGWNAPVILEGGMSPVMAARPQTDWSVLIYGSADNNLETDMAVDLEEMEQVGSSPPLAIVTQVDDFTGVAGGSYRAQVVEDPAPGLASAAAPVAVPIVEPNMGAAATLSNFLVWADMQYPADKTALIIWDHGDGWRGVSQDASSNDGVGSPNDDWLDMQELATGLDDGPNLFNVLAFDACLMAELEVAYQVWLYAEELVASQDCIDLTGYPYTTILQDLEDNSGWAGNALAMQIVLDFAAAYAADPDFTISAIHLDADLLDLVIAVNDLGTGLITGLEDLNDRLDPADNVQMGIKAARDATHEPTLNCGRFADGCLVHDPIVDLFHLTQQLNAQVVISATYLTAIPAIQAALNNVVFAEAHGANHNGGAHGLSLYFPQAQSTTAPPNIVTDFDSGSTVGTIYAENPEADPIDGLPAPPNHPLPPQPGLLFPTNTNWDEFLYRFYRPVADGGGTAAGYVGIGASLNATGSSDADGLVTTVAWDFNPTMNTDALDTDRDGIDEADDDADAVGLTVLFPCTEPGVFTARLVVRDDHESLHPLHFNVDADVTLLTVICEPLPYTIFIPLLRKNP
ncbi:MAG: hypothetical protein KA314_17920 [Chloroflexi bacterium]|nr:hypothetical protein [Chloroflexota bacterium]MBP8057710.1 hypothetical protein [Chloroflexota bacterium]